MPFKIHELHDDIYTLQNFVASFWPFFLFNDSLIDLYAEYYRLQKALWHFMMTRIISEIINCTVSFEEESSALYSIHPNMYACDRLCIMYVWAALTGPEYKMWEYLEYKDLQQKSQRDGAADTQWCDF